MGTTQQQNDILTNGTRTRGCCDTHTRVRVCSSLPAFHRRQRHCPCSPRGSCLHCRSANGEWNHHPGGQISPCSRHRRHWIPSMWWQRGGGVATCLLGGSPHINPERIIEQLKKCPSLRTLSDVTVNGRVLAQERRVRGWYTGGGGWGGGQNEGSTTLSTPTDSTRTLQPNQTGCTVPEVLQQLKTVCNIAVCDGLDFDCGQLAT